MHIKILILTIAFGLVLTADSDDDEYDQWMKKFKKFYTRSEGPMRFLFHFFSLMFVV